MEDAFASCAVEQKFASADEYMAHMCNPSRIVCLEWRKMRRSEHRGWTSHSWIEAHLEDESRLRLEFFAEGLMQTVQSTPCSSSGSVLYEGRLARAHEFAMPLTADSLRALATSIATRPYSVADFNCHHFVRAVWNRVVIDILQKRHYPDRVKTAFMKLGGGRSWRQLAESFASFSSRSKEEEQAADDDESPLCDTPCKLHTMSTRSEEGQRVSGELSAAPDTSDHASRLARFCHAVASGNVYYVKLGSEVMCTRFLAEHQRAAARDNEGRVAAWISEWFPNAPDAAAKIVERIGSTDVVDLVARVIKPDTTTTQGQSTSLASVASTALGSSSRVPVSDMCFVALHGEQLRLAIYAVLRRVGKVDEPAWRLRLVSGDAWSQLDNEFVYTLRDVRSDDAAAAVDLIQEELESIQVSMATNDWAFLTLL